MLDFDAYTDRDGTIRSADVALQHTQQLQYVHDGLRGQLRAHLQLTSQQVSDNHILEVYGRLYMVPLNVRHYLCQSDWTAFQGLCTSMWYQRFTISDDINLMTLMIDNGVLHEIIPFPQQPMDNSWTHKQRCVPVTVHTMVEDQLLVLMWMTSLISVLPLLMDDRLLRGQNRPG